MKKNKCPSLRNFQSQSQDANREKCRTLRPEMGPLNKWDWNSRIPWAFWTGKSSPLPLKSSLPLFGDRGKIALRAAWCLPSRSTSATLITARQINRVTSQFSPSWRKTVLAPEGRHLSVERTSGRGWSVLPSISRRYIRMIWSLQPQGHDSATLSLRLPMSIHTYCTLLFFLINTRFTKKERERMIWSWGIQNISGKGIVFLLGNTHLWPRFNALALMLECTLIHDRCGSSRLLQDTCMRAKSLQSCPTVCDPMDCSPPGSVHGDSPGKYTGVSCHALLQGISPT